MTDDSLSSRAAGEADAERLRHERLTIRDVPGIVTELDGAPMAQLQVLMLPSQTVGEVEQYPFALVLSGVDWDLSNDEQFALERFREQCGAVALWVTPHPVETV